MAEEAAEFALFPGISYRSDLKAWWPDYDHKPVKCKAFVDAGLGAIDIALRYAREKRSCVQAGGHAGFWPLRLAASFQRVHTFEPEPMLYECMRRNIEEDEFVPWEIIKTYPLGLGATVGGAMMQRHVSAGSWKVDPAGDFSIQLVTIDGLKLTDCDAILLDVEGFEVEALTGARETIDRCRPVILVELLPRSRDAIHAHLRALGYRQFDRFGRDGIYAMWKRGGKK